ncbi:XRE family transcriptional regulator [Actinomadura darangshiensis]|uniref:XRE family transcriptional regulator n=2 Tax=Actinomadura darangshiensis TaxID=705336 RepID=A0A4R5A5G0_9ACTN|nr:XRE family transcriptional regulator [Actinomadura darangshiensis]
MRLRRGMSQAALAQPDLSDSYISLVEAGKRNPSVGVVNALAERLGSSVTYLTCGVEETRLTDLKTGLAAARRALCADRPQEALDQLTKLTKNPTGGAELLPVAARVKLEIRHTTALALEALGRVDQAIVELQRLLYGIDACEPSGGLTAGDPPGEKADRLGWAWWATLHTDLARCHHHAGDDAQAVRSAGSAFTSAASAADSGDPEAGEAAVQIGAVLVEMFTDTGEVLLARQTSAQLLQLAQDCGQPHARLHAYQQAVLVAETLGDLKDAAQWAERALHLLETDEAFRSATEWHTKCANLLLRARPDQAERARDLLAQHWTRATVSGATPQALAALAEAELLLGHPDQAAAHARQALHLPGDSEDGATTGAASEPGAQVPNRVAAHALAVLASACDQLGDRDKAITALVRRAEILERHGPRRHAAQAWLHAADLLTPPHPRNSEIEDRRLQYYQRALGALGLHSHA